MRDEAYPDEDSPELNRRYIGIDRDPNAVLTARARLVEHEEAVA